MTDQEHIKHIAAYLSGHLSEAEKTALEQWIKASADNTRVFYEALKIWENSGLKLRLPEDETDQQWSILKASMEHAGKDGKVIALFRLPALLLKVAASFILLAGVAYIFSRTAKNDITVSSGDAVATFYLPDSSKVWLNTGSTLTYPEDFGTAGRRTKLTGEAYFEVRPDKQAPFSVTTRHTTTQVVGTSFNIKEDSTAVILTVSEGIVSFSSIESNDKSVTVNAREKAIRQPDGSVMKGKSDDSPAAPWRTKNDPAKTASTPEVSAPENETPADEADGVAKEKTNPKKYLNTSYAWRKNGINQSVIEGTVKNTALLTDYKNVMLKVTYTKPNGKSTTIHVTVPETIKAGKTIRYQKRLLDILTNTRDVRVMVERAEVAGKGN
jgi:transmembrane sensor